MRSRPSNASHRHGRTIRIILGAALLAALSPAQSIADDSRTAADLKAAYEQQLREYEQARGTFEEQQARPYWQSVTDKRRLRIAKRKTGQDTVLDDYVTAQPPAYAGPSRPRNPFPEPASPTTPASAIPVVADFLREAAEQFQFVPKLPKSEEEYKRAYARVASAAGITRDQAVRVYGFESGGDGKYDVQAGLEYQRPDAHAVSTALGYNQLLNTNSVEVLAEHGDDFVAKLRQQPPPAGDNAAYAAFTNRIDILQKMIAFTRTVPDDWSEHEKLAGTPAGLAVHALNLDVEIGPYLQTQKLLDSIEFARRKNRQAALTAAELEMMNLTGDGNGFDMINIAADLRDQIPTSNFFQRRGYERNPVVSRFNTVAKLLAATDAKMDKEVRLDGARQLAAVFP
jgi:DNA-binding CsgD family transcriptional regulator